MGNIYKEQLELLITQYLMTRKEIAEYCGVTRQAVWTWQTGKREMSTEMQKVVGKMCKKLEHQRVLFAGQALSILKGA